MPIVSGNNELHNLVIAGNDETFTAQLVLIQPQTISGQYQPAKTAAPSFSVRAQVRYEQDTAPLSRSRSQSGPSTSFDAPVAILKVDPVQNPQVLTAKTGDMVEFPERPGQLKYRIERIDTFQPGRVVIELSKA